MNRRSAILLGLSGLIALGFWRARPGTSDGVLNSPPRSGPIVAFGDSLTAGVGASRGSSYPEQLSRLIGLPVLERGRSGETAVQALARLETDVLAEDPSIVIVCLGGNDLLRNKDPEATFAALEEIVTKVTRSGAMAVLVGVEGVPILTADFGKLYKDLASRTGCLLVPDILDGIFGRSKLMSDSIHPNDEGYGIMAERVAKKLRPHLN